MESRIVADHKLAAAGEPDIKFEAIGALLQRKVKRREAILRRVTASATMSEQENVVGQKQIA